MTTEQKVKEYLSKGRIWERGIQSYIDKYFELYFEHYFTEQQLKEFNIYCEKSFKYLAEVAEENTKKVKYTPSRLETYLMEQKNRRR